MTNTDAQQELGEINAYWRKRGDAFRYNQTVACRHEHAEQIGTTALGEMITECVRCSWSDGELITDPAEIEQTKAALQYSEEQYVREPDDGVEWEQMEGR